MRALDTDLLPAGLPIVSPAEQAGRRWMITGWAFMAGLTSLTFFGPLFPLLLAEMHLPKTQTATVGTR